MAQRDSHVCSLRVCEILLHLLDFLLDLGILKTTKRWEKLDKDNDEDQDEDSKPPELDKELKPHSVFMDIVIRCVIAGLSQLLRFIILLNTYQYKSVLLTIAILEFPSLL